MLFSHCPAQHGKSSSAWCNLISMTSASGSLGVVGLVGDCGVNLILLPPMIRLRHGCMAVEERPNAPHQDTLEYMPPVVAATKVHGWQANASAASPVSLSFCCP